MRYEYPSRVLISGGVPAGGISSFAEGLSAGFHALGIPAEVVAPARVLRRWRALRDPDVLKILSLSACLAAPIARRAVCMVHGIPCVANQGWPKTLAILASARLGNASRGVQLVEVSEYAALHMREIFGVRVDAVVHNPLRPLFLEAAPPIAAKREAIVYAGRLHRSKKVDRLLPAIRDALDENQGLRAWIIGDGPLRPELERIAAGDDRIEFFGTLPPIKVRDLLRRARVFVSGCPTEALGIAYMEALSQGCAVVMPASGGGLEIAPELIGSRIELFPISMSREQVVAALRKALLAPARETQLATYSPRAVAAAYLAVDARFDVHGIFEAQAGGSPTSSLGTRCVAGHG